MNYPQLIDLLSSYLENYSSEFTAALPELIRQAESRFYENIRTPDQRFTWVNSIATPEIYAPPGFIESLGMYIGTSQTPLLLKNRSFIRTAYGALTGTPKYYTVSNGYAEMPVDAPAVSGAIIVVGPAPDTTYPYTLDYIGAAKSITDPPPFPVSPPTATWLSTAFPKALVDACLYECYKFMKGEQALLDRFDKDAMAGMEAVRNSAEVLQLRDEYRNAQPGTEVAS